MYDCMYYADRLSWIQTQSPVTEAVPGRNLQVDVQSPLSWLTLNLSHVSSFFCSHAQL